MFCATVLFDVGHGRLMKEWVYVAATSQAEWLPLAQEAMEFVAATSARIPRQ
jgi:hypothetical protein